MKVYTHLLLLFSFIFLFSCSKEKNWSIQVFVQDVTNNSCEIEGEYDLKRNGNFVYVGLCWSLESAPTVNDWSKEAQTKENFIIKNYEIEDLLPNHTYYFRSYIVTKKGAIIYSNEKSITTLAAPTAPCETADGVYTMNGTNYSISTIYETETVDGYSIQTSGSFGELNFDFHQRPPYSNVFKTVFSEGDLGPNKVNVSGVLGAGWFTCYYGSETDKDVYVTLSGDEIVIQLCEMELWPTGSCEENYIVTGEVRL